MICAVSLIAGFLSSRWLCLWLPRSELSLSAMGCAGTSICLHLSPIGVSLLQCPALHRGWIQSPQRFLLHSFSLTLTLGPKQHLELWAEQGDSIQHVAFHPSHPAPSSFAFRRYLRLFPPLLFAPWPLHDPGLHPFFSPEQPQFYCTCFSAKSKRRSSVSPSGLRIVADVHPSLLYSWWWLEDGIHRVPLVLH